MDLALQPAFELSLTPLPEQLATMNLQPGCNPFELRLKNGAAVTANIFLYSPDARVVVSDVDGTITKSDVLGHLYYFIGRDWTQSGVADLYTKVRSNGYEVLYLTSRAIGQISATKDYLFGIEQSGTRLPMGPVITSPDRLLAAFTREVI